MIGRILQHQDLQRLCRPDPAEPPPSMATVHKWAKRIGLRVTYDGNGGLITTVDALNAALGIGPANEADGAYAAHVDV